MKILYFPLPYFHVSNSALFLHSTQVLSIYIDTLLTLSIQLNFLDASWGIFVPKLGPKSKYLKLIIQFFVYIAPMNSKFLSVEQQIHISYGHN